MAAAQAAGLQPNENGEVQSGSNRVAGNTHLVMLTLKLASSGVFMDDHMSVNVAGWYLAQAT